MQLSLVILTLNEVGTAPHLVRRAGELLGDLGVSHEILVLDGGSKDGTVVECEIAGAIVLLQRRPGYGGAVRDAIERSRGDFVITIDGDGSHPAEMIRELWNARERADFVIASRYVEGGSSGAEVNRQLLSKFLNSVYRVALSVPITDFSSACRIYRRTVLQPHHYFGENFDIVPEIAIHAYAAGYSAAEIPLRYVRRLEGKSHASVVSFGLSYLSTLFSLWKLRNSAEAADYDSRAYDSRIPLQRYWQRKRYSLIHSMLVPDPRTLDIGCGSSRIIQSMPESVAFDYSISKLRFLRKGNPFRIRGSTFSLPFVDQCFGQAIHSQLLEHVLMDKVIFRELNRVLKVGGNLVIGTPDYGRLWWPIIEFFYGLLLPNAYADEHITHYTKRMLADLLVEHGFRVIEYHYICGGELIMRAEKLESLHPTQQVYT